MESPHLFNIPKLSDNQGNHAIQALEKGQIVYLMSEGFSVKGEEQSIFNEKILAPRQKNVSYHPISQTLSGIHQEFQKATVQQDVLNMMQRFHRYADHIIKTLFPTYALSLQHGRTSYRPAEIKDRPTSILKDDTRLHVDAFPSTPVQGHRILRVFSNIHPQSIPRVWQVGEPFSKVLSHFHPHFKPYRPLKAHLMNQLGLTKSKRTAYDHFMLQLHNRMKCDQHYQATVQKETIAFPSQSTWIVFTDQVSHAALSGQFLLEQTFYIPIEAMHDKTTTPLHHLQTVLSTQKML